MGVADGVVIKIKGDDSHYKTTLNGIKSTTTAVVKGIAAATGVLTTAWNVVGVAATNYNGTIEQLQTSFTTMTGSAAKGLQTLNAVRTMAADTPFELSGLAETTQLLMNYNLTADEAINKMSMLGDISQGNQDKLTRIATAYGQMSSAQKVSLEDVKQMIEAGFNPLVEISESTGESMSSLYSRISKGTMAVDEITASMERSTSVGGKYYQSMLKQSQTLNGQISTLKDNAQQLMGNMFQGYTDRLRDNIVPAANAIVEDLNDALENGGMDGLVDAVVKKTPQVSQAVSDAFAKGVSGAAKQAPKFAKALISTLPSLLGRGGEIAGALTDALFDVTAAALEGIGAYAPELIDGMVDAGMDIAGSVVSGIADSLVGAGKGIGTALKKAGVLGWSTDELLDQVFGGYDADRVAELKASVVIDPDVVVNDSAVQLTSVYDMIEQQLTDGLADTPEVIEKLKTQVSEYYSAQIEEVNQWKQEQLANLDDTLPQDEYAQAAAEIEAQANAMVSSLELASDQTMTFIDQNAGKSTEAVKMNLEQLEEIYQNALEYSGKVAELTGEAANMVDRQRQVVASGQSKDEATQLSAIGYTAVEYQTMMQEAEEIKQAALEEALSVFREGSDEYAQEEARILAEYDATATAAQQTYLANMVSLWSGIAQAMAPDQQQMLQDVTAALQSRDIAQALLASMNAAIDDVGAYTDANAYTGWFTDLLSGMALTDADYANLAAVLGIDEIDPAKIQTALAEQLSAATAGRGVNSQLGVALQDVITSADGDFQAAIPQLVDGLPEEIKNVVEVSIENGWLQAVGEVDLSDNGTLLAAMAGSLPTDDEAASIGKPVGAAIVEGSVSGALSKTGEMTKAGAMAGAGFQQGLESKRSVILATARSIASAAAGAISAALDIHSPSRVTMRLGAYTGEGFNAGLSDSLQSAVKNARHIVNDMNLQPKISTPDLNGIFRMNGQSLQSDGVNVYPVLALDGRIVAQTMATDNARAANRYNKNIALGVGK